MSAPPLIPHIFSYARSGLFLLAALAMCGGAALAAGPQALPGSTAQPYDASLLGAPLLRDPIWVYNNWSAYDELSDNIPLTEDLAMRELNQIVRLGKRGVHFEYYMMDAFWFAPEGGYRTWRKPNWPQGPDRWVAACRANGIRPGLWFSTNTLVKINAAPAWRDSLNKTGGSMSFYEGGFLPDFMDVLQYWYDHGIRMFKFDETLIWAQMADTGYSSGRSSITCSTVTPTRLTVVPASEPPLELRLLPR